MVNLISNLSRKALWIENEKRLCYSAQNTAKISSLATAIALRSLKSLPLIMANSGVFPQLVGIFNQIMFDLFCLFVIICGKL